MMVDGQSARLTAKRKDRPPSLLTLLRNCYYQSMNKAEYTNSDWVVVRSSTSAGITKVFKFESLRDILAFSKRSMDVIHEEDMLDWAMFKLNGFECIVSLRSASIKTVDARELCVADLIDEVAL